jgi:hypothetical protein
LSVKYAVGEPIPHFPQPSEEGSKSPSSVNRQDAGDILPDHPTGPQAVNKAKECEREVATRVIQSLSESGDAECLAWGSSDQKVDWLVLSSSDSCEVSMKWCGWVVVGENCAGKGFDLGEEGWLPPEVMPPGGGGFDAGADRSVNHLIIHISDIQS